MCQQPTILSQLSGVQRLLLLWPITVQSDATYVVENFQNKVNPSLYPTRPVGLELPIFYGCVGVGVGVGGGFSTCYRCVFSVGWSYSHTLRRVTQVMHKYVIVTISSGNGLWSVRCPTITWNCVTCPSIHRGPGIPNPAVWSFAPGWWHPASMLILGEATQHCIPY